jgi:hypothetical protein
MPTLKFAPHLVTQILSGDKTSTWRLFDDKNIKEGDDLIFINKETGEQFGIAKVNKIVIRTLGTLTDEDWTGHQRYSSEEEMYKTFRGYYGDKVDENTEVKIISFDLL